MDIIKAVLIGIVEGITEWLPISSTGHIILVNEFIHMHQSEAFMNMFKVVIQLAAVMAVIILYFNKLNPFSKKKSDRQKRNTWILWVKVVVATIPAGIFGMLLDDFCDAHLSNYVVISLMLILYGVFFIMVENKNIKPQIRSLNALDYKTAFLIGCFQVLALIPGTSRSGATIIGALLIGVSRSVAAEFTFFLAIPVMFGWSLVKLVKFGGAFTGMEIATLLTGCVVSFLVSVCAIKFLMGYIKKHDFKAFGYYRIVLGILVLSYFMIWG